MKKQSSGFLSVLRELILPTHQPVNRTVSNTLILEELIDCFDDSCGKESVGTSLLFNTYFIIILHPKIYEARLVSLPVIVKEAIKEFYKKLEILKKTYDDVSPVSSSWHFKFGPGIEFNGEKIGEHDIKVIGMLTGLKEVNLQDSRNTSGKSTKVTIKSKRTNVFDKMDINIDLLRHITFLETGTFKIRFNPDLKLNKAAPIQVTGSNVYGLARITYYLADTRKEEEYIMKDKEIVIARKDPSNQGYTNYLVIESGYVSNPHARIRLNETSGKFQIASFSRNETRMDQKIITRSEPTNPVWFNLENESKILLNGMITLYFRNIYT